MQSGQYGKMKKLTVTHTSASADVAAQVKCQQQAQHKQAHKDMRMTRTARNALICTCIICAAVLIRTVDTPVTNAMCDGIQTALTFDIDVEDTLGRLKFVQNGVQEVASVFSASNALQIQEGFVLPIENAVLLQAFDAQTHPYVTLQAKDEDIVYTPASGIVTSIQKDADGITSIALEHADGYASILRGYMDVAVKQDDTLAAGQKIGTVDSANTQIEFALYAQGVCVNPIQGEN